MATPIFYKPRPRWQFLGSLAAALAIEAAAVGLASIHPQEAVPEEIAMPSAPIDAVITELPPESTPPPEEEPPPPPPPPDEPTEFTIQEPTPPPRPPNVPPPKPRPKVSENRGTSYSGTVNYSAARANWTSAPHPVYPYEARRSHATGSGKFLITFDDSGNATDVSATQSTGSSILDQTSINTFRRWRCKPGVYHKVVVPITYTLQGAQL
ncbi:MAG: energy transducer TonB [Chthoniobacterales bacterium]|nr:energy transducer TonB [Chthoniobacterales bacterium]